MIDLTPEDYARVCGWPDMRVMLDWHLERGTVREVTEGEAKWTLTDASKWCSHFVVQLVQNKGGWWGDSSAAYDQWLTSSHSAGSLTAEKLEEAFRMLRYRDCPLYRVDSFDMRQTSVPTARPSLMFMGTPVDGHHAYVVVDEVSEVGWLDWYGSARRPRPPKPETRLRGLDAAQKTSPDDSPRIKHSRRPAHLKPARLDGRRW